MPELTCRAPYCRELVDTEYDVCDVCWGYRGRWFAGLPSLWVRARQALAPTRTPMAARVSTSAPESVMPLRVGPLTAMSEALTRLDLWADTLVRRGAPAPLGVGRLSEDQRFAWTLHVLTKHDHLFEGTGLAGEYYLGVYRAYWRLYRVDRVGTEIVRWPQPCPACDTCGLIERHAGEVIQCLTCAYLLTQAGFSRYVLQFV